MATTKSRGSYERERVRMTAATVERAAAMIAGDKLAGRGAEILDIDTPGLTLRITRASGTWYLRHRRGTYRLGNMDTLTLPAARLAAARARTDVEAGLNPREDLGVFERVLEKGRPVQLAADAAFAETVRAQSDADRRKRGPWQWRDLVEEFLPVKTKNLKEGYGPKYAAYHRGKEFDEIWEQDLGTLEFSDLEALRDRVIENRTRSAAARVVRQNREMLTWAWQYHATRAGFGEVQHPWWDRWAIQYKCGIREHVPTTTELVRTLLMAEHHLALGGTTQETGPGMIAALWAIVLTGQRTGHLTKTRRDAIIDMPSRPGWEVWTWTGAMMKGGKSGSRPHALPIPPAAIEAIRRAGAPDGDWLFPSRVEGKPISPTGINQFF